MIDLLTIRHAPVDVQGLCYGQTDVPTLLTAHEVVARIETVVRGHTPVHLWSSDALRCAEPAELLAARLGVVHTIDPRLRELSYGDWEGMHWAELPEVDVEAWKASILTAAPPGGETFTRLADRVGKWWATLQPGAHVLVAHAGVMHALDVVVAGMTWDETVRERFGYLSERRFGGRSA
jgi:broad specificity phosphatase PhoE